MQETLDLTQFYSHLRVLIGLVLGLGLTRLLSGTSYFVQHPGKRALFWPHLLWVGTVIVMIMDFWWWEFSLSRKVWDFGLFAFVLFYAFLFYLTACVLFPDEIDEYDGYEGYFISRRKWFFGLLAFISVIDIVDTLIKGADYFFRLGPIYPVHTVVMVVACLAASTIRSPRFHTAFAAAGLIYTISWTVHAYWRFT